jgi:integrase
LRVSIGASRFDPPLQFVEAVEIVRELREAFPKAPFVFPGRSPATPLSDMSLTMWLRRKELTVTAHGFRSSFADWRGEATNFPRELAEAALAHVIGDQTEAAYRRGDALDRRRELMAAWALFLDGDQGAQVIPLRRRAP